MGLRSVSLAGSRESLLEAMMRSSFYPREHYEVTHLETHISHLFFAGDLVYKIKKPVRFSFLDFSTLAKRRYFLHEELRLNRRLAPSVYLGVLPVTYGPNGWRLGGDYDPLEYALVMRRLPSNQMLPFLLERDLVTPSMMEAVADILVPFHAHAPRGTKMALRGDPRVIQKMWDDNLTDIVPFVGTNLDQQTFEALGDFGERFVLGMGDLLGVRVWEGRIREVHGDLHCEHICFAPEGIQIFDCIEFSEQLRCCDVASEVAFLIMDLEFRGWSELAKHFLRRYLELTPDPELPQLLPFYKCYRALVRGKVESFQANGLSAKARAYFDFAYRVTWEGSKPFLLLICGLSGTGKSALARRLSQRVGARVISSDATRKAIAGVSGQRRLSYAEGMYDRTMTERTYAGMLEEAERMILNGESVILDATFQRKCHRELAQRLASKYEIPLALVFCHASEQVIRQRLKAREEQAIDPSDATWEIYLKQKVAFEKIDNVPRDRYFALDTEGSLEGQTQNIEAFLMRVCSSEGRSDKS